MSKTYAVAEARRQLSALIERAASGRGPVYIGRRGKAEVALVRVSDQPDERLPRTLEGLCTIADDDLTGPDPQIAEAFESSLHRTESLLVSDSKRAKRRRQLKR